MIHRPRRLRKTPLVRNLVAETRLCADMFIFPCFVSAGKAIREPIASLPGLFRYSPDALLKDAEKWLKSGLNKLLLFGVNEPKSADGSAACREEGAVPLAVKALKNAFADDIYIATDICVCAYTTHGHCGILKNGYVDNDASLELLSRMALAHAAAGADMVAPSDMMDGRVGALRQALDKNDFPLTAIMSYCTKYASAYYGPFRDAAGSSPRSGDRRSYQMDCRNGREALREARLDESEGADILMVKPALAYLDIIALVRAHTHLPVACYNVSGEYAMVKQAAEKGIADERQLVLENLYAFVRAGAGIIISYHTRDVMEKKWL